MGSSDLQIAFPVIIFLVLAVVLGSFFIVNNGTMRLSDNQNPKSPINPKLIGNNDTSDTHGIDLIDTISGIIKTAIGSLVIVFTGWTGAGLLVGSGLIGWGVLDLVGSTTTGQQMIAAIPIVGDIYNGLNYVGTAMANFASLMSVNIFGTNFPLLGFIVGVPLTFFFLLLILRFIRGQG